MAYQLFKTALNAAFNQEIDLGEETSLPNICENLGYLLASDGRSPLGRLSLKTSSILVNGMARLLKQEADCLLKDTFKLSQRIVLNNCERYSEDTNTTNSEDSDYEFETFGDSDDSDATQSSMRNYTKQQETTTDTCIRISARNSQANSASQETEFAPSATKMKRDIAVQTSRLNFSSEETAKRFDKDLPFGVVLIHDKYGSRIPSKVVFSSLNPIVRDI